MSEESRKRVLQLAAELVRSTPGIPEDVLVIRLHRALRFYVYQRGEAAEIPELLAIREFFEKHQDPLEPELHDYPPAYLKHRSELALSELNRGNRKAAN